MWRTVRARIFLVIRLLSLRPPVLLDQLAVTVNVVRLAPGGRYFAAAVNHIQRCPCGSRRETWPDRLSTAIHAFHGDFIGWDNLHDGVAARRLKRHVSLCNAETLLRSFSARARG